MKITLIVEEMIPVVGDGGTGRQVQWLARELVRLGHRVTILAPAGSSHPFCEVRAVREASEVAGLVPPDSDIVHRHGWYDEDMPFKILNTGHSGSRTVNCERGNWNFVSRRHAESHGRETFVYNGFPVDEYHRVRRRTGCFSLPVSHGRTRAWRAPWILPNALTSSSILPAVGALTCWLAARIVETVSS